MNLMITKKTKRVSMIVWNEFKNDARVLKEAVTLQKAGYSVTVHALHTPGVTNKSEVLSNGITVKRVLRSPFWYFKKNQPKSSFNGGYLGRIGPINRTILVLSRIWTHLWIVIKVISSRPSIIESHDINTLPTAWVAAKLCRVPVIYDAHEISTSREGYQSFRALVALTEKFLIKRVGGVITTTETRAKYLARAYKIKRPLVIQNRLKFKEYRKSDTIRRELNLSDELPIVLYQGGFQQGRGLELLVRAACHVDSAYFIFIGGGRIEGLLKNLALEMNVYQRVRFIDTLPLETLLEYTASADIGVQPIENTCFNHFSTDSNKLFEYMSVGLPVIASNLPEIRKLICEYQFGLVFKNGDLDDLVAKIKLVVDDDIIRKNLQNNAIIARHHLNWERQESAILDLFNRLLIR